MQASLVSHEKRLTDLGEEVRFFLSGKNESETSPDLGARSNDELIMDRLRREFIRINRTIELLNRSSPKLHPFVSWIFRFFCFLKRKSDRIMDRRREFLKGCVDIYEKVSRNTEVPLNDKKRILVSNLRDHLLADDSPYKQHRLSSKSRKLTRSEAYLDRLLVIPVS